MLGSQKVASGPSHQQVTMRKLLLHTIEQLNACRPRELSSIAHGFSKCKPVGSEGETRTLLAAIEAAVLLQLHEFNHQDLSMTVLAFAEAKPNAPELFKAIAYVATPKVPELSTQHLCNMVSAFSRANQPAPALFASISVAAQQCLNGFIGQGLASIVSGFNKAGFKAPDLFNAIANETERRLRYSRSPHYSPHDFSWQQLANIALSFAGAGHPAPTLLVEISDMAILNLCEFCPHSLSSLLSAFAQAEHADPALFKAAAKRAVWLVGDVSSPNCGPRDLAEFVSAYSRSRQDAPALFHDIARKAPPLLHEFESRDLAIMAFSFAKAECTEWELFAAIANEVLRRLVCGGYSHGFNLRDLDNIAWAFSKACHPAPKLLEAIAAEAVSRLRDSSCASECTLPGLCRLAWAFGVAGYAAQELFHAIAVAAEQQLRYFDNQDLTIERCGLAWAFAAANHPAPELFNSKFVAQLCNATEKQVGVAGLSQLHQWNLFQRHNQLQPLMPPELAKACQDAFSQKGIPSGRQLAVIDTLRRMNLKPKTEYVCPRSGYSLDATVSFGGRNVAVEVDGPSHFWGRTPTGTTLLKRRQLRAAGWSLLSVPLWEWDNFGSFRTRQNYLEAGLKKATSRYS